MATKTSAAKKKPVKRRVPKKKPAAENPLEKLAPDAFQPKKDLLVENIDPTILSAAIGITKYSKSQIDILRKTSCKGFIAEEMAHAVQFAESIGADIIAGELKVYRDANGEILHVIARDFLKNKAYENPKFSSYTTASVFENDEFEFDQGEWKVIKHIVKNAFDLTKRGPCVGAYCIGRFTDGSATSYLARMSKYKPEKVGKSSSWHTDDEWMIIKCSEAVVLKKFAKLGNVYTSEEIAHLLECGRAETSPDVSKLNSLTISEDEK